MKNALEIDFKSIAELKNPQRRGIQFQRFLSVLLTQTGFEVHENPKVAKPRQSDLFAIRDNIDYLIEAKWLRRKIDSSDIDDLQARLSRAPAGLIGCIVSMSEFASTAVQTVEANRQKEILLFGPKEICEIVRSGRGFSELIRFKRKALRIDGKVWFSNQKYPRPTGKQIQFPESDRTLGLSNGSVAYTEDHTAWNPTIFTSHVPEFQIGGEGVILEIHPEINSHSNLTDYLTLLHNELGLTNEGSFTIAQTKCHWRGFGVRNFVLQASQRLRRYQKAGLKHMHHSEDLYYFDKCQSGFLLFTIRQSVGENINVP